MKKKTLEEEMAGKRTLILKKLLPAHGVAPSLMLLVVLSAGGLAQSNSTDRPQPAAVFGNSQQSGANPGHGLRPPAHSDNSYVIGADDVLAINVWKEPEVSRSVPVRSDGKISLPLVGELMASGETPLQLEHDITTRLASYISEPEVTVIVQDSKSQKINILGMVVRPGSYMLTASTTVLDAIAMAGGFKDFAKQKQVYVLRANADGTEKRMLFNYKDVIKGKNPEQNIRLLPRDTVVVP
jgi:polysaccharide biosynthesis/export protein